MADQSFDNKKHTSPPNQKLPAALPDAKSYGHEIGLGGPIGDMHESRGKDTKFFGHKLGLGGPIGSMHESREKDTAGDSQKAADVGSDSN